MKTSLAFLFALSMVGAAASAQTDASATTTEVNTSSVKTSDVQKPDEKNKDQSDEITNARMRAEAGSKSKFSLKANLAYNGGSVEKPFDRLRPNYRAGVAQDVETSLGGTLALAYRASDKITLRGGTGLAVRTPFHNTDKEIGQNHRDQSSTRLVDISTPYVEVSSAFRTGNWMIMPSASANYYTKQFDREVNFRDFGVAGDLTGVYEFEGSGWQPGLTFSGYNDFFQAGADTTGIDDYNVGVYPFIEYAFNDRYSFRTLLGFSYTHVVGEPAGTFIKDTVYQSMGVGIAMTKEIYFYPNVQFLPDNIRGDLTNVGLSTTMSVF